MKPSAERDTLESYSSINSMIASDRLVGGIDVINHDGDARTKARARFFCSLAEVAEVSRRSRLWQGVMQWLQSDKAQDEYCKARNPNPNPNPNNTGDVLVNRSSEANLLPEPLERSGNPSHDKNAGVAAGNPNPNRAEEVEANPNGYNTEDTDRNPNQKSTNLLLEPLEWSGNPIHDKNTGVAAGNPNPNRAEVEVNPNGYNTEDTDTNPNQNSTEDAPRNPNLTNSEDIAANATSVANLLCEPIDRGGNPNNDNNKEDAAQNPNLNNTEDAGGNHVGDNKTQEATRSPEDSRTRSKGERKMLVLDMDETLVHSSSKPIARYDFEIKVETNGNLQSVFVVKRPGVDRFLQAMAREFELVVFTAGLEKYADPLLDRLDQHHLISRRLYRGSCLNLGGGLVKDLALLGKDLRHVIIVDNSPHSYLLHPDNAVAVSSFVNNPRDRELLELVPFLSSLAKLDNVTDALRKRRTAS